ncbi:MAG: hypothetical protein F4X93_07345 [Proteobacteria bacterium]|nr:hypothetical protein [Pseudomonadota bacterium]
MPLSFQAPSESDYITFLWSAFEINYNKQKYQFAYFAYHMLAMGFIYFKIWQIRRERLDDFRKGVIGFSKDNENCFLHAASPFEFSKVPEGSVFRLLKLLGCDNSKVGTYGALVNDRNEMAHANGHIHVRTEEIFGYKIRNILKIAEDIQSQVEPIIEVCYQNFLLRSLDPNEREYSDLTDQIREALIHSNYLSQKDIKICFKFDIQRLKNHKKFREISTLHREILSIGFPE